MTDNIFIGNLQDHWKEWIVKKKYSQFIVIVDEHTAEYCLPIFDKIIQQKYNVIHITAGEAHKNLATCSHIWSALLSFHADRKTLCINLGGGVIGDMGGFCAATYKRGIDFVQIPTTLLAQVDAAVGGKLGIDFQGFKNVIGLFKSPAAVFIDTIFLNTLPSREWWSGFAEIIKHCLIDDVDTWQLISTQSHYASEDIRLIVSASIEVKRRIVAADPLEQHLRKKLNFGHTIGHAVESYFLATPTPLLHGEAVIIGMICESFLSHHYGLLSQKQLDEIVNFCKKNYPIIKLPTAAYQQIIELMMQDKKNENNTINFTFLESIGKSSINHSADADAIIKSFEFY